MPNDGIERRIDTARELGRIVEQIQSMQASIKTLTITVNGFTATRDQMIGMIRMARLTGVAAGSFGVFMWWLLTQLQNLLR